VSDSVGVEEVEHVLTGDLGEAGHDMMSAARTPQPPIHPTRGVKARVAT